MLNFSKVKLALFDFDGVFTDNNVWVSEDGIESVKCSRSDGIGISRIKSLGVKAAIISTETNSVVLKRAQKLKIECFNSVNDKGNLVKEISKKYQIKTENILFLGNDINDLSALSIVGFPIAVSDSHVDILNHVVHITERKGGEGAVREICDLIYKHISNSNN